MANKPLSRALIAGVIVVTGCVTPPPGERIMVNPAPKNCPDAAGRCDVKVGFDACYSFMTICTLKVDYPAVRFAAGNRGTIVWSITDPAYSFPSDGITFVEPKCAEAIKPCLPIAGGRQFQCVNPHAISDWCKYVVKITGPIQTEPLDPWVVND